MPPLGYRKPPIVLGPTGDIADGDEGDFRIGISHRDGCVILEFRSKVTWMTPATARGFIKLIAKHVEAIERGE